MQFWARPSRNRLTTKVSTANILLVDRLIQIFEFLFLGAAAYQVFSDSSWPTKREWYFMNILMVLLSIRMGYVSTSPEAIRHANPDAIFCAIILLITPLFAILAVNYAIRRWNRERLRRASWDRNPLNWWHDPLQGLFISTCTTAGLAIGAALRRPSVPSTEFWMIGMYVSTAVGLSIGQILVHRIYRERIIPADSQGV
jgi:hypothetical protein